MQLNKRWSSILWRASTLMSTNALLNTEWISQPFEKSLNSIQRWTMTTRPLMSSLESSMETPWIQSIATSVTSNLYRSCFDLNLSVSTWGGMSSDSSRFSILSSYVYKRIYKCLNNSTSEFLKSSSKLSIQICHQNRLIL